MNDWDKIKCNINCKRCNHKGTPSAMKGSDYCEKLRKEKPSPDDSFSIFKKLKMLFSNKGKMRQFGKIKEVEKNE